jgi:hypothetical protein
VSDAPGATVLREFLDAVGRPCPAELLPTLSLVDDLDFDSLLLVEFAYWCDRALSDRAMADELPFFETVGEVLAHVGAGGGGGGRESNPPDERNPSQPL